MRPKCPPDLVDLQCRALAHVAERAPSLTLPKVHATAAGEAIATVQAADGTSRLVWMLTHVPGRLLAETNPHTPELLFSLGRFIGQVDAALADFAHPAARRELKWNLARAGWIGEYVNYIRDPARRALVEQMMQQYQTEVAPALPSFRTSVIHGDANDYNVLVSESRSEPGQVVSVVDFGDMHLTNTVCEPAVAAAYALLNKRDPLVPLRSPGRGRRGARLCRATR